MAYTDQTQYPRGVYFNTLGASRTVATGPIRVSSMAFSSSSASKSKLRITDASDSTRYATVTVRGGQSTILTRGFYVEDGLRLTIETGTGANLRASVVYYED